MAEGGATEKYVEPTYLMKPYEEKKCVPELLLPHLRVPAKARCFPPQLLVFGGFLRSPFCRTPT